MHLRPRSLAPNTRPSRLITHSPPSPHSTMSFLAPGLRRSLLVTTPLILSTPLIVHRLNRPIYCDGHSTFSSAPRNPQGGSTASLQPGLRQSGMINPKIVRQISMGSILGVLCGLGVSVFSKPLALLLGLGIVAVQVCVFSSWMGCSGRDSGIEVKKSKANEIYSSSPRRASISSRRRISRSG